MRYLLTETSVLRYLLSENRYLLWNFRTPLRTRRVYSQSRSTSGMFSGSAVTHFKKGKGKCEPTIWACQIDNASTSNIFCRWHNTSYPCWSQELIQIHAHTVYNKKEIAMHINIDVPKIKERASPLSTKHLIVVIMMLVVNICTFII